MNVITVIVLLDVIVELYGKFRGVTNKSRGKLTKAALFTFQSNLKS